MAEYLRVISYTNKIRLGDLYDGGYVIADIPNYDLYISAGVGGNESFSNAVINKFNIPVSVAFDGTISELPKNFPKNMLFIDKNIGSYESNKLSDLKCFLKYYKNIFLKMDIEGGEFDWLLSLTHYELLSIKQIAIEFHNVMLDWDTPFEQKKICYSKLFDTHYIVHAHANNWGEVVNKFPVSIEFTYVRKDIIGNDITYNKIPFPIPGLDCKNHQYRNDITLNYFPFVS